MQRREIQIGATVNGGVIRRAIVCRSRAYWVLLITAPIKPANHKSAVSTLGGRRWLVAVPTRCSQAETHKVENSSLLLSEELYVYYENSNLNS